MTESSEAYELGNVVETALAKALVLAAEARRWDVVAQIAEELRRRSASWPGAMASVDISSSAAVELGMVQLSDGVPTLEMLEVAASKRVARGRAMLLLPSSL